MEINDLQEDNYSVNKLKEEKKLRLRIIASLSPIILGLLSYFIGREILFNSALATSFSINTVIIASISFILLGLVNILYWYLQTGFKTSNDYLLKNIKFNEISTINTSDRLEDAVSGEVNALKEKVDRIASILEADTTSFENISETIKRKIELEAGSELLAKFRSEYIAEVGLEKAESKLTQAHATSSSRLSREIDALGRRGNINLILGVITTIAGLLALVYFILKHEQASAEPLLYAMNFLPRLTLVIFIEVFAYFFLKLYKVGLSEIKYFQNELTNLESKHMALLAALRHNNSEILLKVIGALSDTERNHILEKGQTTVEVEKMQLEKNQFVEVAQTLASLIPKSK